MSSDDECDFSTTDALSSHGNPVRAGEVKVGDFILIQNHVCKVVALNKAKTGKHGHAKVKMTGLDIFNGDKYIGFWPTSHTAFAPEVTRKDYILLSVSDDGFANLMDPEGASIRSDLMIPPVEFAASGTDKYAALERAVAADAAAEGTVTVTVLTALEVAMVLPHFTFSA